MGLLCSVYIDHPTTLRMASEPQPLPERGRASAIVLPQTPALTGTGKQATTLGFPPKEVGVLNLPGFFFDCFVWFSVFYWVGVMHSSVPSNLVLKDLLQAKEQCQCSLYQL